MEDGMFKIMENIFKYYVQKTNKIIANIKGAKAPFVLHSIENNYKI